MTERHLKAVVPQRSMAEIRRLVAEDEARWYGLAAMWNELTVAQQRELVATAAAMLDDGGAA